jgi:hypothetical protein
MFASTVWRKYSLLTLDILMFYISSCYNVWVNELTARYLSSKSGQKKFPDDTSDYQSLDRGGLWTGRPGFDSRQIFLFFTVSRPPLGPTQPSVQWVLGTLKRPRRKSDHLHLVPRPRMVELYLRSPIHLQDVVFNLTDMCKEIWIHYQCSNIIYRLTFMRERISPPKI